MNTDKKQIVDLMAATGADEQETQVATARFDTCKDEKEKAALLKELKAKRKPTAAPEPGPSVATKESEKGLSPSVTAPGQNKGKVATFKATRAAKKLADEAGVNLADVPTEDGKIGVGEVRSFIESSRNG